MNYENAISSEKKKIDKIEAQIKLLREKLINCNKTIRLLSLLKKDSHESDFVRTKVSDLILEELIYSDGTADIHGKNRNEIILSLTHCKKETISANLFTLKKDGMIESNKRANYKITNKGLDYIKNLVSLGLDTSIDPAAMISQSL